MIDASRLRAGWAYLAVADDVEKGNDIGPTRKVLQDLDLTLDFLLLNWLENLDHAFLVVDNVDTLEYLAVFTTACGRLVKAACLRERPGGRESEAREVTE